MSSEDPAGGRRSVYRHRVRYLEVDQQGVVFNMWYLGYFDEAMSVFLEEGRLPYADLLASGHDLQLVRSEVDWRSPLRHGDEAEVEVRVGEVGRTSFSLLFEVGAGGRQVARGRTVYVAVSTDGSGKVELPGPLRAALGPPAGPPGPLR